MYFPKYRFAVEKISVSMCLVLSVFSQIFGAYVSYSVVVVCTPTRQEF